MPDSKPPRGSHMPVATIKEDGSVRISLRTVLFVLMAFGVIGGGGGAGANWILNPNSEAINTKNGEQDKRLDQHDSEILGLTATIGQIQETQRWQASDQAAVRLCENEPDQKDCEKRMIRVSMDRMKYEGKTRPCTNLDCTD